MNGGREKFKRRNSKRCGEIAPFRKFPFLNRRQRPQSQCARFLLVLIVAWFHIEIYAAVRKLPTMVLGGNQSLVLAATDPVFLNVQYRYHCFP